MICGGHLQLASTVVQDSREHMQCGLHLDLMIFMHSGMRVGRWVGHRKSAQSKGFRNTGIFHKQHPLTRFQSYNIKAPAASVTLALQAAES